MQPTLAVTGLKEEFSPYEKVELGLKGKRGNTSVSLAVRDAYQADGLFDNGSILTEMLLSSEIRGFVPDPGWFFEADDAEHRQALDLLMMTQGWRRFVWRDMAVKGEWELTRPDEKTPLIEGKVYKDEFDTKALIAKSLLGKYAFMDQDDEDPTVENLEEDLGKEKEDVLREDGYTWQLKPTKKAGILVHA